MKTLSELDQNHIQGKLMGDSFITYFMSIFIYTFFLVHVDFRCRAFPGHFNNIMILEKEIYSIHEANLGLTLIRNVCQLPLVQMRQ